MYVSIEEGDGLDGGSPVVEFHCRGTGRCSVHLPLVVPDKGEHNRFSSQMVKKASVASKRRCLYNRIGAGATGRRRGPGNGNKPRVMKDGGCCSSWGHHFCHFHFHRRRGEKAITKAEAAAAALEKTMELVL
jgi:hypothetical protein